MKLDDAGPAQLHTYLFTRHSMGMIHTVLRNARVESVSEPHTVHMWCWSGVCSNFSTRVWAARENDVNPDTISNVQLFVFS